ncbi:hypothetical protein [Paenibacillus dendritiformis]|nr:hypothetical protein [Paenibacillus dendritiformis]CAH8772433.1 BatD family protein [Paenibacillus dendritiformis]
MKKWLITMVLLVCLGCQSFSVDRATDLGTGGDSTSLESMEEGLFSAHISLPQKVRINEEFTIKAELKQEEEQKLAITSREQLFVYTIKDGTGKEINSYAVTDGGKIRNLTGKAYISENYTFKIQHPGMYEVSALAEFTVNIDGKSKTFAIHTAPKNVEVTE